LRRETSGREALPGAGDQLGRVASPNGISKRSTTPPPWFGARLWVKTLTGSESVRQAETRSVNVANDTPGPRVEHTE